MITEQTSSIEPTLLECLRKTGKALIASGTSVGVVENTLTKIALTYDVLCEVIALPNILMIKIGAVTQELTDFSVQRPTTVPLHQTSALAELIDRVVRKEILPQEASKQVDQILALPHRFHPTMVLIAYVLSIIGLTLLFRYDAEALIVTGVAGVLVGVLLLLSNKWPRYNLLLPIFAATLVSALVFSLTKRGIIIGPANLIIPPLVIFLPGALLTTGMIELASMNLISGSARLMYGVATLFLLFIGIGIGLNISNLPSIMVSTYEASAFPWWAPLLGTFLFGVGTFIRLSGANRDLFWMLLVLYIAMAGQTIGESYFGSYIGAFIAAFCMALSSELIARSPRRTPALVSQALAFWFLVPGARGLLSVTNILSGNYQNALIGLGEVVTLITAIALGVLFGTLITSPDRFVPIKTEPEKMRATRE